MKNLLFIPLMLLVLCTCAQTITTTNKIPLDTLRWYQLNYTHATLNSVFDGNVNTSGFTGWSKILGNYDAYYPLENGEQMTIESIRFYDREGMFNNTPMTLSVITDTWERIPIASFKGLLYNTWVGPYPDRPGVFKLGTPVTNVRYLVLNIYNNDMPAEIELYGTHTAPPLPTKYHKQSYPLKNMFGINGFEWNVLDGTKPKIVDELKMNAVKSFTGFRHYMDWEKLEEVEGRYMFSPTARGGWHYDTLYKRLMNEGVEVLACLKTMPPWMIATYPDSMRYWDNTPVKYGDSYADPQSYYEMARVAFQYVARYGSNKNVDPSRGIL